MVKAEERACAGYNVVVSGRYIAQEREAHLKAMAERRKNTTGGKAVVGKQTSRCMTKSDVIKGGDGDLPLLPAQIGSALRLLSVEYQILCSTDARWDAVEGAARKRRGRENER